MSTLANLVERARAHAEHTETTLFDDLLPALVALAARSDPAEAARLGEAVDLAAVRFADAWLVAAYTRLQSVIGTAFFPGYDDPEDRVRSALGQT